MSVMVCFHKCISVPFERCPKAIRSVRAASRHTVTQTPRQGYCLSAASLTTSAVLHVFTPGVYERKNLVLAATSVSVVKASQTFALGPYFKGQQGNRNDFFLFLIPAPIKSEVGVYISQGDGFEREIKANDETLGKMGSVKWNQEQTNVDLLVKAT